MKRWALHSKTYTETLEQQKSNSWTPVGPTKDRASSLNLIESFLAGTIIKPTWRAIKEGSKVVNRGWV